MKRVLVALVSLLLVASAVVAYRTIDACSDWQEQYKRFIYSEMMKNSPVIYTEKMIEEIIGGRPAGCGRPSLSNLSHEDSRRFRREGVGPNEFAEEQRAAFRQSNSSERAE